MSNFRPKSEYPHIYNTPDQPGRLFRIQFKHGNNFTFEQQHENNNEIVKASIVARYARLNPDF